MDLERLEGELQRWLPQPCVHSERLVAAMHYSLRPPAKRLRPRLVLAAWSINPCEEDAYPAAAAIEYIHTYSLIHDDLPCMDNSPLRRGKPSCHTQFDEATALLAGNTLLTRAFEILCAAYRADICKKIIATLTSALGSHGLMGGQMQDILAQTQQKSSEATLDFIHRNKTAALLSASLQTGALLSPHTTTGQLSSLNKIGLHLGLAFQFIDDLLDAAETPEVLGKPSGQDINKLTSLAFYGLEGTFKKTAEHLLEAKNTIQCISNNSSLLSIHSDLDKRLQDLNKKLHSKNLQ